MLTPGLDEGVLPLSDVVGVIRVVGHRQIRSVHICSGQMCGTELSEIALSRNGSLVDPLQ